MKCTLLFIACVLASITTQAQENSNDYIPFVDAGKTWKVARSTPRPYHNEMDEVTYYIPLGTEKVNGEGKAYYKMIAFINDTTETDMYLIREEDRKIYLFDTDTQKEYLMFDYSLNAGDTYETYSPEYQKIVKYEVWSVEDYTEGPEIVSYVYDEKTKKSTTHRRYLKKWVVQSEIESMLCLEPKIWIEGVGSLEGPFASLYDGAYSFDHLAYVLCGSSYLPFSFSKEIDDLGFGCNLPTGEEYYHSEDMRHQLNYELEGDRLHVYGKVLTHGGANNYAYFIEEPNNDSSVRKLHFKITEIGPLPDPMPDSDGLTLRTTDFYVEGFPPALDYIIIDNQGEEHPVINKVPLNVYRPFIEDGKIWVVKVTSDELSLGTEYCYLDGDTIIGGQTAKRMLCDRIYSEQNSIGEYIGAWYEQDKKVYYAAKEQQQFELLYDFTFSNLDIMPSTDGSSFWVVNKWTGIWPGFKGTCYNIGQDRWYEGVGSESWPYVNHPWEYDGLQGILLVCSVGDEIIYYNTEEDYPYVMKNRKRFDFTHTIKTKPQAPMKEMGARSSSPATGNQASSPAETEQTLYGEYNEQQLNIPLDPLVDTYLVRITDETDKAVYEKDINAASIVGLNIDISAYPKGRYTVTVENSRETFTGEFETEATGVVEVKNKRPEASNGIYNLQGQRLTGKPSKGVYIENGRKKIK